MVGPFVVESWSYELEIFNAEAQRVRGQGSVVRSQCLVARSQKSGRRSWGRALDGARG